jgi:hypothetical protein
MDKELHDRLMDKTIHVINLEITGQMKTLIEAQADMLGISVSEFLSRIIHGWLELVAKTAGYTEIENKN